MTRAPRGTNSAGRSSPVTGLAQHCHDIPLFFGVADEPSSIARIGEVTEEDALGLHDAALAFIRGEALEWAPRAGVLAAATGVRTIGAQPADDDFAAVPGPALPDDSYWPDTADRPGAPHRPEQRGPRLLGRPPAEWSEAAAWSEVEMRSELPRMTTTTTEPQA